MPAMTRRLLIIITHLLGTVETGLSLSNIIGEVGGRFEVLG
jgi:hypothetical protein